LPSRGCEHVGAEAEDDLLGVEKLAGVIGGAVFSAAAAFDAGERLEGGKLRDVLAGDEAEVFVAVEGRDVAELAQGQEYGDGAEDEVEMLGVGDEWEENEYGGGV
jgi:hypothetical protein